MLHYAARRSSLVDKPFSPKAADRLPLALTKYRSKKRTHARTQRSSSRTSTFSVSHLFRSVFLQDKLKDRRSFLRLAARYFLRPRRANLPGAPGLIEYMTYHRATTLLKCKRVALHMHAHVAVDRARAGVWGPSAQLGPDWTAHVRQSWRGDFFFWIRGSTDLRRFERILGGSGSIRVSVDSFYPYFLPTSRYLVYTFSFSFRVEKKSRECLDKDNINMCAVSLGLNRLSISLKRNRSSIQSQVQRDHTLMLSLSRHSLLFFSTLKEKEKVYTRYREVGRKVQIQTRYKGDELSCSRRRVVTDFLYAVFLNHHVHLKLVINSGCLHR